jgi:hypothetical protein
MLLTTAYAGFDDAASNFRQVDSGLETLAVSTQLLYATLSVVGLVGLATKRPWTTAVLIGWAVAATTTATLATVAWGGGGLGPALAAGLGAAAITALVVWAASK